MDSPYSVNRLTCFPGGLFDDLEFDSCDEAKPSNRRPNTMTTFQSVNMGLVPRDLSSEVTTPTTPRAFLDSMNTSTSQPTQTREESAPTTPTRNSYIGARGKRALPTSPFSDTFSSPQQPSAQSQPAGLNREDSHRSARSSGSQDVEMDDSDDGEDGSDGESMDDETGRPSKKKKGQRFFCTDFPPCNLSFTRSEHLARHIRYVWLPRLAPRGSY